MDSSVFYPVEDSAEKCDGYSVIRHRHLLFFGTVDSAHYVFPVEHAGATVNDQVVRREILREVSTRNDVDGEFFTDFFS